MYPYLYTTRLIYHLLIETCSLNRQLCITRHIYSYDRVKILPVVCRRTTLDIAIAQRGILRRGCLRESITAEIERASLATFLNYRIHYKL